MSKGCAMLGQAAVVLACGVFVGALWCLAGDGRLLSRAEVTPGTYADVIVAMKEGVVVDGREHAGSQVAFGGNVWQAGDLKAARWRGWAAPEAVYSVVLRVAGGQRTAQALARILAARWSCHIVICSTTEEEEAGA